MSSTLTYYPDPVPTLCILLGWLHAIWRTGHGRALLERLKPSPRRTTLRTRVAMWLMLQRPSQRPA